MFSSAVIHQLSVGYNYNQTCKLFRPCAPMTFTANPRPCGHFTNKTNFVFLAGQLLFNAVCPLKFNNSCSRWLCLTEGSPPTDIITSLFLLLPPLLLLTVLHSEDLSKRDERDAVAGLYVQTEGDASHDQYKFYWSVSDVSVSVWFSPM